MGERALSSYDVKAGTVGSALLSGAGNIYTGVCIDTKCGMGFCAEAAVIASMVTNGESRIDKIVAVYKNGKIVSPCGRCREFMYQIHDNNAETDVILGEERTVKIKDLLPEHWYKQVA